MYESLPSTTETMQDAIEALYRAMGEPEQTPVEVGANGAMRFCGDDDMLHPVFPLARHYFGKDGYADSGYTGNCFRGDHLTIPAYSETGEVYALDISFHKGMTYETCVRFPQAPQQVKDALYELLEKTETR